MRQRRTDFPFQVRRQGRIFNQLAETARQLGQMLWRKPPCRLNTAVDLALQVTTL